MWSRSLFALVFVLMGCVERAPRVRYAVSIAPLAWVVEGLTGEKPTVVVPPGTSPESYEPTARQIEALAGAELFFSIGLIDFEQRLETRLKEAAPEVAFLKLADSLELMDGVCGHGHHHGNDPHVWLSPTQMRRIVGLVANRINTPQIEARRDSLYTIIDALDAQIAKNLVGVSDLAIVHPSLGYFCADYGLTQHAVEVEGKEPSGVRVRALVDTLQARGLRTIFYSIQDPDRAARVIAAELKGSMTLTPFDPVAQDWPENLKKLSQALCNR